MRFISAFVERLPLGILGLIRAELAAAERPGYHPGMLLKRYIYGYLNRVCSSLTIGAREAQRKMKVTETAGPDFKTIAEFRWANSTAIVGARREFMLLCRELDPLAVS